MAFRDMNRKRHIGLKQLSSLASAGRALLGPVKSSKFIVDESTHSSVLICSAVRLLESLDFSSAVGQLLNETIQAQNEEFKTGTSTLLFLVGAWSKAVLECLQQDVPLSVIVDVMSEGLNSCLAQVKCLAIAIPNTEGNDSDKASCDIGSGAARNQMIEIKTSDVNLNNSVLYPFVQIYKDACVSEEQSEDPIVQQTNISDQWGKCSSYLGNLAMDSTRCAQTESVEPSRVKVRKSCCVASRCNKRSPLTYSRYFSHKKESPSQHPAIHLDESAKLVGPTDLKQLARSLCHGNWPDMKLLQHILQCEQQSADQMTDTHPFQFNISKVVTCCLPGMSESHSCVCPGYVTLVCLEAAVVVKRLQDRPLKIILADGDLAETYCHLGFNRSLNVRTVFEHNQENRSSCLWVDSMLDILIRSNVNLILVQGNACETLEERCLLNSIVIINQVAHNVIQTFSDITGAERVTYLSQVNEHCIGNGVCMSPWTTGELNWLALNDRVPVIITMKGNPLITAVLSSPVISMMQAIEDHFWARVYRLHHALLDQAVFPGGGAVEILCLSYLEKMGKTANYPTGELHPRSSWLAKSLEQYKPLVFNALAHGWHQYLCAVMCNTADCASEFEASIAIQQHLRKAAEHGSASAYILDEFRKEKMGVASFAHLETYEKTIKVYDNVMAKMEAWRRALDLVLLVLQTDAEIITGPKRDQLLKTHTASELMFL